MAAGLKMKTRERGTLAVGENLAGVRRRREGLNTINIHL